MTPEKLEIRRQLIQVASRSLLIDRPFDAQSAAKEVVTFVSEVEKGLRENDDPPAEREARDKRIRAELAELGVHFPTE